MELTDRERKIVDAMKMLGATAKDKLKTADDIARKAVLPKNLVANDLLALSNRKIVKRVVREKAAGYFLLQQI
ncbi:MAG: transcriptional regulator [Candidatus Aenigmarchaeota archaeon]|nr:transcriptional regulator [Candidatus Aenigmarchaeota archaeon]